MSGGADDEKPEFRVKLAHETGHQPSPDEALYWDVLGALLALGLRKLDGRLDLVLSLWLSRATHELRRNLGPAEAARVLHQFADQMDRMDEFERAFNNPGGTA